MLDTAFANRFIRKMTSGKTRPSLMACDLASGKEVELVTKLSAGCETGVRSLAAEAIAAMLAADLDLPCPEPFLVQITAAFAKSIPDAEIAEQARKSVSVAFGSLVLPHGFAVWPSERPLPKNMWQTCGEIIAFDGMVHNPDRRVDNPNCLYLGEKWAIFDHDLAFSNDFVLGWRPPWARNGLDWLGNGARHALFDQLRGKDIDFSRLKGAWDGITEERIEQYGKALPPEWELAEPFVNRTLRYITELRENIEPVLNEVTRVLG